MSGVRDDAGEDEVGLQIAADEERMRAGFREAALFIEGDGARVVLPDAEPERFAAGDLLDLAHQRLGDAFAVMLRVDVEARELDVAPLRGLDAEVRIRDEVAVFLADQHDPLFDFAALLRLGVRAPAIRVHVFGAVLGGERLAKGALAECGEGGSVSVGGVADSHLQAYDNGMTVATEMTADELLRMPDDGSRYELVRGELRKMSPSGAQHSAIGMRIGARLATYILARKLGEVYGADGGFRLERQPDTVLAADVAFVRAERFVDTAKFFEGPPDLAVEVISPSDTFTDVEEKTRRWLSAGTRVVVVVNPRTQSVFVYRESGIEQVNDVLAIEDVVPGWKLPLSDLFA